jgi:predicted N-acetyltransferase YhbS
VRDGRLVGTVTVATQGGEYSEQAEAGAAVVRMLAVSPAARGTGVGGALVQACIDLAREAGCTVVRLSTQPTMTAAHRVYERLGFTRTPERDWSPVPEVELLTYQLPLVFCGHCGEAGSHEACLRRLVLEPPRYCTRCRRRMVVQVHPTGWSARCVEHGTVTG